MGSLQSLASEPGVEEVLRSDAPQDWEELDQFVQSNSENYVQRYQRRLQLRKVFRVRQNKKFAAFAEKSSSLGAPTRLFHGSKLSNAHAIARDGFKLLERAGMFGKGVYFAECPLKSATFSRESCGLTLTNLWRLFSSEPKSCAILVSDIYLGKVLTRRRSANQFNPGKDLKAGAISKFFGQADYNSVYAPGGFFAAVNVDEYVIYDVEQTVPQYLLEFDVIPVPRK